MLADHWKTTVPYHNAKCQDRFNKTLVNQVIKVVHTLNDFIFHKKKILCWDFLQTASVLLLKDNLLSMMVPKYLYSASVNILVMNNSLWNIVL